MPKPQPRRWHRGPLFGDGPCWLLSREQRARFRQIAVSAEGGGLPVTIHPNGGLR